MCFLSTASKKRKSLTISAPIPCNTAFPPDHPALSKLSVPEELANKDRDTRSASTPPEVSESEDSSSAGSVPGTPSRQSVCSESEAAKHHTTNGNDAEQAGSEQGDEEDDSTSSPLEDMYTSEQKDEAEPEPGATETMGMTICEEENKEGEGEKEQSEEINYAKSQQTDGSRPPGFLYKVRSSAVT